VPLPDDEHLVSIVQRYQEGTITLLELTNKLIEQANWLGPKEMADLLPPEVLQEMRARSATPPEAVEKSPRLWYIGWPLDPEAHRRHTQQLYFDGIWRWHRYFEQMALRTMPPHDSSP
jgi:hypothetical protein